MAFSKRQLEIHGKPIQVLNSMSQITDFLYIGSAISARDENILKENKITNIINVTVEEDRKYTIPVECMKIKIYDNLDAQIGLYFDIVADKIEKVRKMSGKTLVHCMAGISRSSTMVIAYLMKYNKMSLTDAYDFVKKKRSIISPNPRFWQSLIEYEKRLYGKTTVTMKKSKFEMVPELHKKSVKSLFNW